MANEKRLIADALKKYHDSKFTPGVYQHSIFGKAAMLLEADSSPVDAVEVVHGRFELIEKAGVDYWRCSACQEIVAEYYHEPKYNYCPHCGAKMDGERREGNE